MSFLLLTPPPCLLIPPPPLSHRRSSSLFLKHPFQPSPRPLSFCKPSALRLRANTTVNSLKALETIKPYLQSESKTVLLGWLCSCVSVVSLSQIVPRLGSFTSNLNANAASLTKLKGECLVLAGLVLAKVVAYYLQQAFLWEAALNTVYKIRVFAYRRVLERELEFFEGGNGISSGDIAYRITAEASEVADTIYALLNVSVLLVMNVLRRESFLLFRIFLYIVVILANNYKLYTSFIWQTVVPSAIQISVMTAHMIVASPALTLVSAMVSESIVSVCVSFALEFSY